MRNLFKMFFNNKKQILMNEEEYYNYLTSFDDDNLYAFDKRFVNQEEYLYKLYGNCDTYNRNIKMIVVSDTHNCLK